MSAQISAHALANIWPDMSEDEFSALSESINADGLKMPIVTWQGVIVDGRHRYRACVELGVEPRFAPLPEEMSEADVAHHCAALHTRRNLTADQRAAAGAELLARYAPAAKARQGTRTDLGKTSAHPCAEVGRASKQAANSTGASQRMVERMGRVLRESPEDFEAVKAGKMTSKLAERIVKKPPEKRAAARAQLAASGRSSDAGDSWGTPEEWIALARKIMGSIDVDPASNDHAQKIVRAKRYFTKEKDGLQAKWKGNVWLNPPYSQPLVSQFTQKLIGELLESRVTQACVLVNNACETEFYQTLMSYCHAALLIKGRISFNVPDGEAVDGSGRVGQTLFYFGSTRSNLSTHSSLARFVNECEELGVVVTKLQPDYLDPNGGFVNECEVKS